ncbi:hypothetical protein SUDANB176_05984 [Streptomyces sp. enrichment culture]
MIRSIVRGGVAGAAATTSPNAVAHADMAGRAVRRSPARVVDGLAGETRHPVPGTGGTRDNRPSGLGALSGIAVGCGIGVAVSLPHRLVLRESTRGPGTAPNGGPQPGRPFRSMRSTARSAGPWVARVPYAPSFPRWGSTEATVPPSSYCSITRGLM